MTPHMLEDTHITSGDRMSEESERNCNGLCVTGADIGFPGYSNIVAYPHPLCIVHGDAESHVHEWSRDPSRPGMSYCAMCWTDGPPLVEIESARV